MNYCLLIIEHSLSLINSDAVKKLKGKYGKEEEENKKRHKNDEERAICPQSA